MRFWPRADRTEEAQRSPTFSADDRTAGDRAAAADAANGSMEILADEPAGPGPGADGAGEGPGQAAAREGPLSADGVAFIGRGEELELFRRMAGLGGSGAIADGPQVLLICGSAGTGKRELLKEFRRQCEEREPPACAPVIDLGEPQALDDLMEQIALGLEPEPDVFQRFHKTLRGHRDAQAGKRSTLVQASEGLLTAGRAANEIVPSVATGVSKGLGELIHHGAEKIEASQRARSVRDDFVSGLVELAGRSVAAPPVLLFSDVDRWADDPTVVWLRRSLLPKLPGAPVLIVASAQAPDKVGDLASQGTVHRLDRFPDVEAREYVERVLKVRLDTRLARDVLADSDGFPERLGRYKAYFEQFPEAYHGETLSDDARAFAAGGSVLQFLTRWDSALPRQLVLYAAPLRWFNATLLRDTVSATGLAQAAETATDPVSSLLDPATRPPWIRSVGAGWGLDEPSRRRAFVDELRRFDPAAYRSVHALAAQYHHSRLLALEGRDDEAKDGAFFDYVPTAPPTTRFENPEYVEGLAELLYHSLALKPDRGFRLTAEHAAAALFYEEPGHAGRLLDLGPELELPKRYDVYLRQLAELASAIGAGRQNEALQLLEQLEVAGSPSDMVAAVLSFLRGTISVKLGFFEGEVLRHLERAQELFKALSGTQRRARRMRFASLVWLARTRVSQNPNADDVLSYLEEAKLLADELDEPELPPEWHRTRALVLRARGDVDGARRECDRALTCLRRLGAPRDVARVLQDRAGLLDRAGDTPGARRDLLSARELYKQLESSAGEAEAAVALMEVELCNGDVDGAEDLREEVLALRPRDPQLLNSIGLAYHRCKRYAEAVEEYDKALELDPLPLFYANRALARWAQGHRPEAIEDAARAFELAPTDVELGLWLAELKRQTDDWVGAAEVARHVSETALEAARAEASSGGAAAGSGVPPALSGFVSRLLELLDSGEAADLLGHCVELFPADPEFHFLLGMALREDPGGDKRADRELLRASELAAAARADPRAMARYLTARADLLAQARRWEQAERLANEALALCPGDVEAQELRARIQRVGRRDLWERDDGEVWPFAAPIRVEIAEDLAGRVSEDDELIGRSLPELRKRVKERSGVELPAIAVRDSSELAPGTVQIVLHNVPHRDFAVLGDHLVAATAERCRTLTGAKVLPATCPWDGAPAAWVGEGPSPDLLRAGIPVWDVRGVILAALESTVEEQLESFVGFSYTAAQVSDLGLEISPEEQSRLTAVVGALVAAGVPIRDLGTIVTELRGLDPAQESAEVVGVLRARLGASAEASPGPELYALGAPASTPGEEGSAIRVRVGAAEVDPVSIRATLEAIVDLACARLTLPRPTLELDLSVDLPKDEYEVHVGGLPRIAASLRSSQAGGRLRPGNGSSRGRSGLCPMPEPGTASPSPERAIGLALEAAIWDDPSLLLPGAAAERLVAAVLPHRIAGARDPLEAWSHAFREVAAQRVSLHGADDLEAARRVVSTIHPALGDRPGSLVERHESAPERPIPDNLPLGVRDRIEIIAQGPADVVHVRAHVRHSRPEHLRVRLVAPDGTSATLADRSPRQKEDLLLDHNSIGNAALGRLVGHEAEGTWTLHVLDLEPEAVGTLMSWSLEVEIGGDPGRSAPAEAADSTTRGSTAAFNRAIEHVTYAERVAEELRSYEVTVRVGERLGTAVGSREEPAPGRSFLEGVAERFFLESGLRLGRGFGFEEASRELGPWDYEISINDLPRSCAAAPESSAAEALSEDLLACLREAAPELLGVGWTERYLEHLSVLSPPLVAAVRRRCTVEVVCWLFRRLLADGFSLRDDRILDCLLEFEASMDDLAGLWRYTRTRLRDSLAFRLGGEGETVGVIELDEQSESGLRSSIATEGSAFAGYSATAGLALLRQLRALVERRPDATPPVLVTAPDLRAHVGRIVAAQFPSVPVVARDELRPEMETELVGRIAIEKQT